MGSQTYMIIFLKILHINFERAIKRQFVIDFFESVLANKFDF